MNVVTPNLTVTRNSHSTHGVQANATYRYAKTSYGSLSGKLSSYLTLWIENGPKMAPMGVKMGLRNLM